MKKFTLLTVAVLLSVMAFGQKSLENSLQLSQPVPVDMSMVKVAPEGLAKKAMKKAPRKKADAEASIAGGYQWAWYTTSTATYDTTDLPFNYGPSMFKDNGDGTYTLYNGLDGMYKPLSCYIDEDGWLAIPRQECYRSSTYGPCDLVAIFYYEGDTANDPGWYYSDCLYGYIYEDGVIDFSGYLFYMLITSGTYANYRLNPYNVGSFMIPDATVNGFMEVTNSAKFGDGATNTYVVTIEQKNSVVSVANFQGRGQTVNIYLDTEGGLTVPQQLVDEGDATTGPFYSYAADFTLPKTYGYECDIEGPITGTYDENSLNLGNYLLFSTNGYWTGAHEGAKIYYANGDKFKKVQPAELESGLYVFSATEYELVDGYLEETGIEEHNVQIKVGEENIQIQGLCKYLPRDWVQGTYSKAGLGSLANGLYFGTALDNIPLYLIATDQNFYFSDFSFAYDPEIGGLTSDNMLFVCGNNDPRNLDIINVYSDIKITRYEKAVTPDGITDVNGKLEGETTYFDLQGRKVNENAKGVVLMKVQNADGTVKTLKSIRK